MKAVHGLLILIIVGIIGIFAYWSFALSPVDSSNTRTREFEVRKGETIREISDDLQNQGLIKDANVFYLMVKKMRLDEKVQAGLFKLSPSMSSKDIAEALQVASADTTVTIPEGKRAEEIADILQKEIPSFTEDWRTRLNENEGYLFPDTYAFPKDATIDSIILAMRKNFELKYGSIPDGKKDTMPRQEIVTIASLIEREAKFPEDRALVASVILNRIKIGMALQIDATVQYAIGYYPPEQTWWKKGITVEDLKIDSPYNTYANPGLPPQPISNPGLEVIKAVLEAPDTDYLYYISDDTGHNHYARTFAEHAANIKKYGLE